ncbi:hypothetical protein EMN47_19755 [Prolixibacteraceae bacterium JC049]|nr:hypothetical protein [Prolixibacteraceae bacterium JC049]
MSKEIYIGNTQLLNTEKAVQGELVQLNNETYYRIGNYDKMADFFMSIVSDSDHWMFLSSNGSLSAGRKNRDHALFPYYTVDKIHDYQGKTGATATMIIEKDDRCFLWEPFSNYQDEIYRLERNLYKSIYGNKVVFEEINHDLGVRYRYAWYNSEKFGFVKSSEVKNVGKDKVKIEMVDGIKNILPSGIDYAFQNEYSNLLDGYKKNELLTDGNIGLFMLSSIPVDRAEPSESLRATTVWYKGVDTKNVLLSEEQLDGFKKGRKIETEIDIRARRGAFLLNAELDLEPAEVADWMMVAEIDQDAAAVANLAQLLKSSTDLKKQLKADIELGTQRLIQKVSNADGWQQGNDTIATARHFSNTMFNIMRGGIFNDGYKVAVSDFILFLKQRNKSLYNAYKNELTGQPEQLSYFELNKWAESTQNMDLVRLANEYLPLTFSRRHGDPSRPWNLFSIDTKHEDGSPKLNYQGNWRDIFQNWEALALSYPEYISGMISQFLNASTADGYNPYRVTREGIDWECPDPEDPWAYIGYWGDHQIIYLQKFLELSEQYYPNQLQKLLEKEQFVYANVPYRIKSYEQLLANPQDTVVFDHELNKQIEDDFQRIGADAKMLAGKDGQLYRVNLTEKILVTLLTKLSNFIPEAGIWLNTQRPEWNDANNALVGNGASMVTLYYLRRFLSFWQKQLANSSTKDISLSIEVAAFLAGIHSTFNQFKTILGTGFSNEQRKEITDCLGIVGSDYRNKIYNDSFTGKREKIAVSNLSQFISIAIEFMDQSIEANRREDGLFHAYNLVALGEKEIAIRYLYPMLEGQVAVLSAGYLQTEETIKLLDALKSSQLYREDQWSYLLYPDRELVRFVEKNNIPNERVVHSPLLSALIKENNHSIISKDDAGIFHFNADFRNAQMVDAGLNQLDERWQTLVAEERKNILDIYEELFDHQSFTGRSGTFYAYEGLGSIYWHMVSKLLLAVQENFFMAKENGASEKMLKELADHYNEVKKGIGMYKSPEHYGAFPIDAYSHTPGGAGVKQPGMTGQVKEDVIVRMREVGVEVIQGEIHFNTSLLSKNELLQKGEEFVYYNQDNKQQAIELTEKQFAFTYCNVPVIYSASTENSIKVYHADGTISETDSLKLNRNFSEAVFGRSGTIKKIEVNLLF